MATELEAAYVQILPSFRGFGPALTSGLNQQNAAFTAAGQKAGRDYGKGLAAGAKPGVRSLRQQIESEINTITGGTNAADSLLKGGAITAGAGAAALFGLKRAADAAGNLNAAIATSEQVFGSSSQAINQWSENSVEKLFLSQRAATEWATTFAVFGKQGGLNGDGLVDFSTTLTQLAADLAAFKNTDVSDAAGAIQSGLVGEAEPLRRYGVLLSEARLQQEAMNSGITDTLRVLTPTERIMASYALILRDTADAQGQAAREAGELASQQQQAAAAWENAQADFGRALVPLATAATQSVTGALQSFQELDQSSQGLVARVTAVGAAGAVAFGGLSLMAGGGLKLADALDRMKTSAAAGSVTTRALQGVLKGGLVAGVVVVGLDLASDAINNWIGRAKAMQDTSRALADSLAADQPIYDQFLSFGENLPVSANPWTLVNDLLGDAARGSADLGGGVSLTWREIDESIRRVGEQGPQALVQLRNEIEAQRGRVDETSQAYRDLLGVLQQIDAERGVRPGEATGGAIAAAQAAERERIADPNIFTRFLPGMKQVVDTLSQGTAAGNGFEVSLSKIQARSQLAAAGLDSAAAAAGRYRSAIEAAGSEDNILSAALTAGSGFRALREGTGRYESEADRKKRARDIAVEQDRIASEMTKATLSAEGLDAAMRRLDPSMSAVGISASSAAAGAQAFRTSIDSFSSLDDQVASTLSLSEAYESFRKTFRRLPAEITIGSGALDQKLRPRQREAISNMLQLGDATQSYLSTLIESGRGSATVRAEADKLRSRYVDQFRQLGLNEAQIEKYLETLGLTPEAVETAIRVSGVEESRAKLQAYVSLLEGKIPGSLAASVIASVESGDIEGAASQLANFAATNPIDIPVTVQVDRQAITTAQDALDQLERRTMSLPQSWDAVTAAVGGYTEEQTRGLEALIAQGDAAQEVIAEFIGAGRYDEARAASERFREEFRKILAEYGVVGVAAERYLDDLLQISETDVNTAITLSGVEESVTKLTLLQTLLQSLGKTLPQEVASIVNAALGRNDFAGAAAALQQYLDGELNGGPGVTLPVNIDITPGSEAIGEWREDEQGNPVLVPATSKTPEAKRVVGEWRLDEEGRPVIVQTGANTNPAVAGVQAFRDFVSNSGPAVIPIEIQIGKVRTADGRTWGSIDAAVNNGARGGGNVPGFNVTGLPGFASGGPISGPGTGTSDSIVARLSNGEYVMQASAVRSLGVDFLHKLNKGYVPGFAMGGVVGSTPTVASSSGASYQYTVVEAQSKPRPEDAFRVWSSQEFLAGFNR